MVRTLVVVAALLASASAFAGSVEEAEEEMRRAKVALDRHDYEGAVGHYLVARSLAPDSSGPYLGLGLAWAAQGRCDEAVPVLQEYLRRKTKEPNPAAQSTLSACHAALEGQRRLPPPPAAARLVVTSDPPGAEVRIDDEGAENPSRGRTPLELSLPPGAHTLTVTRPGFREELRTVSLVAGQLLRQSVTLQPALPAYTPPPNGKLHLDIKPVEAQVSVNGMPAPGPVKRYDAELPPGIYHVVVSRAGYETAEHDLIVRPGESASQSINLVSAGPREARHRAGIAIGVILAAGAVAGAITLGVIYGTPTPETHFGTVVIK
jgi:hypothetical protein